MHALSVRPVVQVDAERSGDVIARGTLEDVTKMMLELGKAVYIQELEGPFLKRSKDFFLYDSTSSDACRRCLPLVVHVYLA